MHITVRMAKTRIMRVTAAATGAMRKSQAEVLCVAVATLILVDALPEPWLVAVNAFDDSSRPAALSQDIGSRCERVSRSADGIDRLG